MTCPVSLVILAVMVFITQSQHASLSDGAGTSTQMPNENPLTSHILDTTRGKPASNVKIILYQYDPSAHQWVHIQEAYTNQDGRVGNLISSNDFRPGTYKLFFETKSYFASMDQKTFYPYIEVVFEIEKPEEHYHVPILLNPYGYSTYRGS